MNTPTQTSFAELEYASKKHQTRQEKFLAEMEQVVPWVLLLAKLEPHYPQSGRRGRQPMPLNRMLRIHCMQQWFSYSEMSLRQSATTTQPIWLSPGRPLYWQPERRPFHQSEMLPKTVLSSPIRSNLSFDVAVYRQYHQLVFEVGIVWGVTMAKPEHAALLLG